MKRGRSKGNKDTGGDDKGEDEEYSYDEEFESFEEEFEEEIEEEVSHYGAVPIGPLGSIPDTNPDQKHNKDGILDKSGKAPGSGVGSGDVVFTDHHAI